MEFTPVDFGVGGVALVSGYLAWVRGLTRELFALFGWTLAAVFGVYMAPLLQPIVEQAPMIGQWLEQNCLMSMIAAVTLLIAFGLLLLSVFTPLASSIILESALAPVDRALGFVFGVARGLAIAAVALLLYQTIGGQQVEMVDNAQVVPFLTDLMTQVEARIPTDLPAWIDQRAEILFSKCSGGSAGTPASDS
ncbi:MAG: CvpA family protein [Pseudomonadota bacterium]